MNLFGVEFHFSRNGDTPVKRKECHLAQERIEKHIDEKFEDTNRRIDDLAGSISNYLSLLKK